MSEETKTQAEQDEKTMRYIRWKVDGRHGWREYTVSPNDVQKCSQAVVDAFDIATRAIARAEAAEAEVKQLQVLLKEFIPQTHTGADVAQLIFGLPEDEDNPPYLTPDAVEVVKRLITERDRLRAAVDGVPEMLDSATWSMDYETGVPYSAKAAELRAAISENPE